MPGTATWPSASPPRKPAMASRPTYGGWPEASRTPSGSNSSATSSTRPPSPRWVYRATRSRMPSRASSSQRSTAPSASRPRRPGRSAGLGGGLPPEHRSVPLALHHPADLGLGLGGLEAQGEEATVAGDGDAGDPGGVVAGQERRQVGDVLRPAGPGDRLGLRGDPLGVLEVAGQGADQRRSDGPTGGDGVDADVELPELLGGADGQHVEAGLEGGVAVDGRERAEAGDRRRG